MRPDWPEPDVPHPYREGDLHLDAETLSALWGLFAYIPVHWESDLDPEPMKLQWQTFLNGRMRTDPQYAAEYRDGADLLRQLVEQHGDEAYVKVFTTPWANHAPPRGRLARLRQLISNEFIDLWLTLGGFKTFGAKNYPGYFGGANLPNQVPYRSGETS